MRIAGTPSRLLMRLLEIDQTGAAFRAAPTLALEPEL
jgi:hypothetical protein